MFNGGLSILTLSKKLFMNEKIIHGVSLRGMVVRDTVGTYLFKSVQIQITLELADILILIVDKPVVETVNLINIIPPATVLLREYSFHVLWRYRILASVQAFFN